MALTHEIDDAKSPISRFFAERFSNLKPVYAEWRAALDGAITIRPPTPVPWGTVGMAIDYRIRCYLGTTGWHHYAASKGAYELTGILEGVGPDGTDVVQTKYYPDEGPNAQQRRWQDRVAEFVAHLDTTIKDLGPSNRRLNAKEEEALCRCCYVLALFEELCRSQQARTSSPLVALADDSTLGSLLSLASSVATDDLAAMSWRFFKTQEGLLERSVLLNPTFAGSNDIGGADADFIADGCLIDIKATIDPTKGRHKMIYQLLGYVFLDYEDEYNIDQVGVYLARQGVLLSWPLQELIATLADKPASLGSVRKEFRDAVADARSQERWIA